MRKVAVMTDTVASVPLEIQKEYGIKVIPFHIIMDGEDYLETEVNINQLYTWLKDKENLPTTSFSSPEEHLQAYQELSQNAEAILYICMTAAFTGGYDAAIQAKEMAREKLPQTSIEVIDSKTLECSQLFVTLAAARAAVQGKNLDEVIQFANDMIPRVNQLSIRDTLFYLDKGGRICEAKSWAKAEAANSFRAIVEIDSSTGGITKPVARAKTKVQIMEKMVEIVKERVGDKKLHFAIAHVNVPEQAEQLKQKILSQFQCDEFYMTEVLPVAAIHNGEGLIELGFYSID
jgi:DegV family protein with EDD domain